MTGSSQILLGVILSLIIALVASIAVAGLMVTVLKQAATRKNKVLVAA